MSAPVSNKPPPLSVVVRVGVYDSHILHTPSVWVHQHSMLKPNNRSIFQHKIHTFRDAINSLWLAQVTTTST
jgi:hypothetical protein